MNFELIKHQLTFAETIQFCNGIVDSVFTQSETGEDVDYSPESLLPLIKSTFLEMYTDYEFDEDFDKNFEFYMDLQISDKLYDVNGIGLNMEQFNGMLEAINDKIEYRKQLLLDSKASQSKMYSAITTLFETLNAKAQELDMKKFDKIIKRLNPQEIVKAYQKSGIGNDVRDKAITEQAQEIKELKNQISARNVKA